MKKRLKERNGDGIMKNKIWSLLVICCLLLSVTSCANSDNKNLSEDQANAYFAIFENLYGDDPGLNSESKYLAIDLTNVKLTDTAPLIELFQNFCNNNDYILLQDNFEGLEEKGYIEDLYFKDGFIISFDDMELNGVTLVTAANKWRAGDGAIGATFTVEKKNNLWEITKTENNWIS